MPHVRPLNSFDLPYGLALSRQAGWNQEKADWHRCIDLAPDGCFVAEIGGTVVGTMTTCLFGQVAWVAMVLVDSSFRRLGVARAMMEQALSFLEEQGAQTVRLDATPMGLSLYESLGFKSQFDLARFGGLFLAAPKTADSAEIVQVPPECWNELAILDEKVTHTDRRKYILRLLEEHPEEVRGIRKAENWLSLITARPGANALQLGPCLGDDGPALLFDASRRHVGRLVFLDIPSCNQTGMQIATNLGLKVQRRLTRMVRGRLLVEDLDRYWVSSGPEKG